MKTIEYIKMKRISVIIIIMTGLVIIACANKEEKNQLNKPVKEYRSNPDIDGYVPNNETAIRIAEAIWLPIYGNEIYEYKPFKATLNGDVWEVTGTLHTKLGGTPFAAIQKRDAKIINVTHEE
jgi:hypothetical protein